MGKSDAQGKPRSETTVHGPSTEVVGHAGHDDSRMPPRPMLGQDERIAGRFRIIRLLGQGGVAQVYEAEDLELDTFVALKVIRPDRACGERAAEQIRHEVQLARQVTHRGVCRVFDLFEHRPAEARWGRHADSLLVVSMELLEGETLAARMTARMADGRSVPGNEAMTWLEQVADALDSAHGAGVVHGDLSANNVMLVADGEDAERAVVTDFGLAQKTDGSARPTVGGTPVYQAPELRDQRIQPTPLSDVYALAVLAHELLQGVSPGTKGEAKPVSRRVTAALRRGLDPRPESRFASGRALISALRPRARGREWLAVTVIVLISFLALMWPRDDDALPRNRRARAAYLQGVDALANRQLEASEEALASAARAAPSHPLIELAQAELEAARGYRGRALSRVDSIPETIDPEATELLLRVEARTSELRRDWVRAEELYRSLINAFPAASSDDSLRLAKVLTRSGNASEAAALLASIQPRIGDGAQATFELARALAERARADLPTQLVAAERARSLAEAAGKDRLAAEAGMLEAEALDRAGRGDLARQRLETSRNTFDRLNDRFSLALITLEFADRTKPGLLPIPFDEALAEIAARDDPALEARMLTRWARERIRRDEDIESVHDQVSRAARLAVQSNDAIAITEVRNIEALLIFVSGDAEGAEAAFAVAVEAAKVSGNQRLLAGILGNHARVFMHLDQRTEAWKAHQASIDVARGCGCQDVLLLNLHSTAIMASFLGKLETTDRMRREVVSIAEASGDLNHQQLALSALYRHHSRRGEHEAALDVIRRQRLLLDSLGLTGDLHAVRGDEAETLGNLGRLDEAEAILRELLTEFPLSEASYFTALFHIKLAGVVAHDERRIDEADRLLGAAAVAIVSRDAGHVHWMSTSVASKLEALLGRPSRMRRRLLALATDEAVDGEPRPALVARMILGRLLRLVGDTESSRHHLRLLIADPEIENHNWILDIARRELSETAISDSR